jgi:hypothetical protein
MYDVPLLHGNGNRRLAPNRPYVVPYPPVGSDFALLLISMSQSCCVSFNTLAVEFTLH